jgi:hypothetical protein
MPNPGWWEHIYDRVRGKEPMGNLPGMNMLTPPPGSAKEMAQPDSPYTPGKPLNALGARVMGQKRK